MKLTTKERIECAYYIIAFIVVFGLMGFVENY